MTRELDRRPAVAPAKDAEDTREFERAMTGVTRIRTDPRGRVRTSPSTVPGPRRPPVSPVASETRRDDAEDDINASFIGPGVDRRELRKLRRGDYVPGRRLDLHGSTAADALASIARFIGTARHRYRCVCIVHGQGRHSEGSVPIVKVRVREALRRHPAVLAFADAPPSDGGAGAVYVLLRR